MITLTRKDWAEIYYALETKSLALRQGKYRPEDNPARTPNGSPISKL